MNRGENKKGLRELRRLDNRTNYEKKTISLRELKVAKSRLFPGMFRGWVGKEKGG